MTFWLFIPIGGFSRLGIPLALSRKRRGRGRAFVYAIAGDHGLTKVGRSASPEHRLRELQTGSPYHLHIAHMVSVPAESADAIEREAHALLGDRNYNLEWFSVSPSLATAAIYGAIDRLGVDLSDYAKLEWPRYVHPLVIAGCVMFALLPWPDDTWKGWMFWVSVGAYLCARRWLRRPQSASIQVPDAQS